MKIVFTICSNNYLSQASVLGDSVKEHFEDTTFYTILVDEYVPTINYEALSFKCIQIRDIEPQIDELVERYNIIELNTCVKPAVFQYFYENFKADELIYFDPDIKIFEPLVEFDEIFKTSNIILTPHVLTPIEIDSKTPSENTFLNYGLYNLGFIGIKATEESYKFVMWWKDRTYKLGYINVCEGIFVDQLYIDLVPIFFKGVHILFDMGYNMAPWNLHERVLSTVDGKHFVNGKTTLKFYHFSSFKINKSELPLGYYNRFEMLDRNDLVDLYKQYNEDLLTHNYLEYATIECVFMKNKRLLQEKKRQELEMERWNNLPVAQKLKSKLGQALVTTARYFFSRKKATLE